MREDREEADKRRFVMMKKEHEIRESKNFMSFIKNTEDKINDIVHRGQQVMLDRQASEELNQMKRNEYEDRLRR